jgi:hypothetical protein
MQELLENFESTPGILNLCQTEDEQRCKAGYKSCEVLVMRSSAPMCTNWCLMFLILSTVTHGQNLLTVAL